MKKVLFGLKESLFDERIKKFHEEGPFKLSPQAWAGFHLKEMGKFFYMGNLHV